MTTEEKEYRYSNIVNESAKWRVNDFPMTWYLLGAFNDCTQMDIDQMNREYAKAAPLCPPVVEPNPFYKCEAEKDYHDYDEPFSPANLQD